MKLEFNEEKVDVILRALEAADKKSFDPVYGNLIPRIELIDDEKYSDLVLKLEEFEVFSVVEALMEVVEEQESFIRSGDVVEEDIVQMSEIISEIENKYGISL